MNCAHGRKIGSGRQYRTQQGTKHVWSMTLALCDMLERKFKLCKRHERYHIRGAAFSIVAAYNCRHPLLDATIHLIKRCCYLISSTSPAPGLTTLLSWDSKTSKEVRTLLKELWQICAKHVLLEFFLWIYNCIARSWSMHRDVGTVLSCKTQYVFFAEPRYYVKKWRGLSCTSTEQIWLGRKNWIGGLFGTHSIAGLVGYRLRHVRSAES